MFPCGERKVEGGPVAKTESRPGTEVSAVPESPLKNGDTNRKEGQSRVSGEESGKRTNLRRTCGSLSGS